MNRVIDDSKSVPFLEKEGWKYMEWMESRIANLENLQKAGTVVLGIKDSQKDIFNKEYQQALTAINHIVQESKAEAKQHTPKQKNGWIDPCEDPCADPEAYQDIALHRTHTMVSFIGSRGTGKTSAMLTVRRQLQTLRCCKELEASLQPLASTAFICLEPIDAGILQSGEDIIAIVLARMFNYLQQITNGNNLRARYQEELRSLYREFDKLYQNLCRLRKGGGHFLEGESALRGLQNLASSHSTAREFKDLVSHLLIYIKTLNGGEKDQYLVIALDDIDMYGEDTSQNCYTLLEEIFDYLSFPGIIVLTTYNENLLKRNCSNHLRIKFFEGKKNIDCDSTERTEINKLVQQFLEKLIIEEYRVYMPMLARVDVSNQAGMSVRLDKTKEPELCAMFNDCTEQGNEIIVPAKKFLLRIIADRTYVYFDSRGQKRHFFEPYNLRDLSVFWRVLDTLETSTGNDDADRERAYANNRRKLFNYTMNPFASEKLEEGESEYLAKLSQYPLERQERELIDEVKRRCNGPENSNEQRTFLEGRWQHNYGELLHCLYYATRLQKGGMSKELIYCILSSFSFTLNQLYYSPDFKTGGESRKIFTRFVGSSIAGMWANDMLPKFRRNVELAVTTDETLPSAFDPMGAVNRAARAFFDCAVNSDVVYGLFGYSRTGKKTSSWGKNRGAIDFLQAFELLGLFFTDIPKDGFKFKVEEILKVEKIYKSEKITIEKREKNGFVLKSGQSREICFNALNFVVNCMDVKSYFDRATKMLTEMVTQIAIALGTEIFDTVPLGKQREVPTELSNEREMYQQMIGNKQYDARQALETMPKAQRDKTIREDADKIAVKVMSAFQKYSLRNEFENWAKDNSLPLPLQNFDMMYNIIKRLANTNYYGDDFPEVVGENEVFNAFQQLYQSIGCQLAYQDEFYNKGNAHTSVTFEATYKSCPFYKCFVESPSQQLEEVFTTVIKAMTRGNDKIDAAQIT